MHWKISLALTGIGPASTAAEIERALQEAASTIEMMRTAYGSNLQCSRFLAWTVAACLAYGRKDMARPLLEQAMQLTGQKEELFWQSDLCRLEGLLLQAEGAAEEAVETCFEQALTVARAQGARIFELRAAVDLSRLRRDQGRLDEARSLLSPLYSSFAEGLETPDLRAARELLALMRAPD